MWWILVHLFACLLACVRACVCACVLVRMYICIANKVELTHHILPTLLSKIYNLFLFNRKSTTMTQPRLDLCSCATHDFFHSAILDAVFSSPHFSSHFFYSLRCGRHTCHHQIRRQTHHQLMWYIFFISEKLLSIKEKLFDIFSLFAI